MKYSAVIVSLVTVLFSVVSLALPAGAMKAQTLWVKPKKTHFQITLPSNPGSTGFRWFLVSYDPVFVKPVKQKFYPSASEIVGAPGRSVWQFMLRPAAFVVPHVTRVVLTYGRPWDMSTASQKVIWVISGV